MDDLGNRINKDQHGQDLEEFGVVRDLVDEKYQQQTANYRYDNNQDQIPGERNDGNGLGKIILDGKVENHNAQNIGERRFVNDEFFFCFGQVRNAGNGNGTADNC